MTTWASEMSGYQNADGTAITGVRRIVFDVVSDADGQFLADLTAFGVNQVLSVSAFAVGQTITPATDVVTLLSANIIDVTATTIKGVLIKGNSVTIAVGLLFKSLLRGAAGVTVRLVVTVC
jgi:hypothetical protein